MFCRNCGTQNPDGAKFCAVCGERLDSSGQEHLSEASYDRPGTDASPDPAGGSPESAARQSRDTEKNGSHKKRKVLPVICILVIAVLLLGGIGWFGYGYLADQKNEGTVCTVDFDPGADEGEVSSMPDAQDVVYGDAASCPAYPVRYGYVFGGWYLDEGCTKEYDFSKAVKEDLTLYALWLDPDSEEAQISDEEYAEYIDCLDEIYEIYSEYVSEETGYVDEEDYDSLLSAVGDLAEGFLQSGTVSFYSVEDETVYIEFTSLLAYLFSIPQEGMDSDPTDLSGTVCLPYYGEEWANNDSEAVDEREDTIVQTADAFTDLTIRFADVSCIEGFDYAEGTEIFIWHGHGGYIQGWGELMATSDVVSSDPDSLSTYIAGTDDTLSEAITNKSIIGRGVGYDKDSKKSVYAISSYYVENYFPVMDDAIVYLATCKSGYTSQLADAFLAKGAEVVIANAGSENINTEYNQTMVSEVFSLMSGQDEEETGFLTVSEALDVLAQRGYAKSFYKKTLSTVYQDAYPSVFTAEGDSDAEDYTLFASLEGVLTLPDGASFSDVLVTLENTAAGTTWYTFPEEDGSFSFNRLDGGEENAYVLEVSYSGTVLYTSGSMILKKHRRTDLGTIALNGIETYFYVTNEDGADLDAALVILTDDEGNEYQAAFEADEDQNAAFRVTLMPGSYTADVSCDGYKSVSDTVVTDQENCSFRYVLEAVGRICITQLPIIDYDQYDDNEGDSCIFHFDGSGLVNVHGDSVRNGSTGVDGTVYSDGLEVWIARWNYTEEMSWASITYELNGDYTSLTGGTGLIESYNTTDFDTTIYFYDGDTLLASYHMTPSDCSHEIDIDVTGVEELTIYVSDNAYAQGGTSFALYDMFLE